MTVVVVDDNLFRERLVNVFNSPSPELINSLDPKILLSLDRLSLEKKINILLNNAFSKNIILETFLETYPQCHLTVTKQIEIYPTLKRIVFDMKLWNTGSISVSGSISDNINDRLASLVRDCSISRKFTPYSFFYIFGCPLSTDIDVAVVVKEIVGEIDISLLRSELTGLGYSPDKPIDYNLIILDENDNIAESSKGGKTETQNMILCTYKFHHQKHCLPASMSSMALSLASLLETDIEQKIRSTAKFILDNFKILIESSDYTRERTNKIHAYSGYWNRVTYVVSCLALIQQFDNEKWRSCFKSLTMKIIQIILAEQHRQEYTKIGLSQAYDELFPGHGVHVLFFLTRGVQGIYSECCFHELLNHFKNCAEKLDPIKPFEMMIEYPTEALDISVNPTVLSDLLYREFIKSPDKPTDLFVQEFKKICLDQKISKLFPLNCRNLEYLSPEILKHVIALNQRTPEWCKALTYYKCGKNSGVVEYTGGFDGPWVEHYYNLIRGCIVELMVIENFNFRQIFKKEVEVCKIIVGLLVENRQEGSRGIAPDLLLKIGDDIIPVEIKCLLCRPNDNANFRRAIDIAQKELKTSCDILNVSYDVGVILIIFVYLEGDRYIFKPYIQGGRHPSLQTPLTDPF